MQTDLGVSLMLYDKMEAVNLKLIHKKKYKMLK